MARKMAINRGITMLLAAFRPAITITRQASTRSTCVPVLEFSVVSTYGSLREIGRKRMIPWESSAQGGQTVLALSFYGIQLLQSYVNIVVLLL